MQIDELLGELDYKGNPHFLEGDELERAPDFAHVFRRARQHLNLRGVYVLQRLSEAPSSREMPVPVVYVCDAEDEDEAARLRRLVWNQNVAPFVLIRTKACVRLFSGFNYAAPSAAHTRGRRSDLPLDEAIPFDDIARALSAFKSHSIDDGTIWRTHGKFVTPRKRVDWSLLENLKKLDEVLIKDGLEWRTSHALIGKYVYLWYLKQRSILSPQRLQQWEINSDSVFSRQATLKEFRTLLDKLDDWLNGSVFPLEWTSRAAPRQEHLRRVASVFTGDTLDGQLHLPFDAYDFSFIPIETLSAIYEQFLHAHEPKKGKSRGKELGAYYTPVPLVNFMLEELDDRVPLKEGMTCLDPSCGSGAFLVQCYRRLIENKVREDGKAFRRPVELRDMLVRHIFGVDRDPDACRVTELSLLLTMLDYVDPPDLTGKYGCKLPDLHNKNIFEADFFDPDSTWAVAAQDHRYDWIVGNPPWVELDRRNRDGEDRHAWKWIESHSKDMPVSGNQLAEVFLWKVMTHLSANGSAAMLAPAMTLFKQESESFRKRFFGDLTVRSIANFANLAYVLFAGRAEVPAAALFYGHKGERTGKQDSASSILTYSPLVANQDANKADRSGRKKDTWAITISASEIREIPGREAASGSRLPWKLAMWGTRMDQRLLDTIAKRSNTLEAVADRYGIEIQQGPELREVTQPRDEHAEKAIVGLLPMPELIGKPLLEMARLRNTGRIYAIPQDALVTIPRERAYLRKRGGKKGLSVCKPPHVIVDASRRFAIYSDEFIVVPPRQIGITGPEEAADLLKVLSLYLSSDFALYHQFLLSPQMGVHAARADLATLESIPFPVDSILKNGMATWTRLHGALVTASARRAQAHDEARTPLFFDADSSDELPRLEQELNEMVTDALGLGQADRWLIEDFVHVRMRLVKGKVDPFAVAIPDDKDLLAYAGILKEELDSFFEVATDDRHVMEILAEPSGGTGGPHSAMIAIHRAPAQPAGESIRLYRAGDAAAGSLQEIREQLLEKRSQWLYFNRGLRCYMNGRVYLFKPMQRLHWLRSQALVDAGEIIADLAGAEGK